MDETDLENECQCNPCPNCGGFADPNPCQHGDYCGCSDEERAEALRLVDREEGDQ